MYLFLKYFLGIPLLLFGGFLAFLYVFTVNIAGIFVGIIHIVCGIALINLKKYGESVENYINIKSRTHCGFLDKYYKFLSDGDNDLEIKVFSRQNILKIKRWSLFFHYLL